MAKRELTDDEKAARQAERERIERKRSARLKLREETGAAMARRGERFRPIVVATQKQWAEDREATDKADRRRAKLGLPAEGFDGRFVPKPTLVENPMLIKGEMTGREEEDQRRRMNPVEHNIRHDVLEFEYAHKRISEEQKIAGDRFQAIYQRAGIGGAQAINYGNPKVDGGGKGDTLTDAVMQANQDLKFIAYKLGQRDFDMLCGMIGLGRMIKDEAKRHHGRPYAGPSEERLAERYIGNRFRDALGTMVGYFGIVAEGKSSPIRTDVQERSTHRPDTWETHVPLHFGATG